VVFWVWPWGQESHSLHFSMRSSSSFFPNTQSSTCLLLPSFLPSDSLVEGFWQLRKHWGFLSSCYRLRSQNVLWLFIEAGDEMKIATGTQMEEPRLMNDWRYGCNSYILAASCHLLLSPHQPIVYGWMDIWCSSNSPCALIQVTEDKKVHHLIKSCLSCLETSPVLPDEFPQLRTRSLWFCF
jgi:hypothetical protein